MRAIRGEYMNSKKQTEMAEFGRAVKLRLGTTTFQPGWILNNKDMEYADYINEMNFNFEYTQPIIERIFRFDKGSLRNLSRDESYFAEKRDELEYFKRKYSSKLVKAHAQIPASFNVTPQDVEAWMKVQQSAGIRFIEILDVTKSSTTEFKPTLKSCFNEVKKEEKAVLGINMANPSTADVLLRIEEAKRYGIDYMICYGSGRPTTTHLAVSEALKETDIFVQYAGLKRSANISGRRLELAHLAQALGYNAISLFLMKVREKPKVKRKLRMIPPSSYDQIQWEQITMKERLEKYGDEWRMDVYHPVMEEKTTREIYELQPILRRATLRSFEALAADYELRKTEAAMSNIEDYSSAINEKPTLVAAVNALLKEYPCRGQKKLDKFY